MIYPTAKVGDLAELIRGVVFSKEESAPLPTPGHLPVLRAGNITEFGLTLDDLLYIPEKHISPKQKIKTGDIVIATSSGSLDVVGKSAQSRTNFEGSFGAFCKVLRPNEKVDARYFAHYFSTPWYRKKISSLAAGANINNLKNEHLTDLEIPAPSLNEQRRIAAILDQADALRAKRREALAELDGLAQAIFVEMFGDPVRNNKHLRMQPLGALGNWQSGGTPPRSKSHYFDGTIPWFSSGELETMYINKSIEHISTSAISQTSTKKVPCGSLMLGMYDTAALKASISAIDCACNQAIAFCLIDPQKAITEYVYYAITIGKEHFKRMQRGVRQKNLNLSMIREIQIPDPELARQQVFSIRIQAVESLKATHRTALIELDALFASLQHRAFRGEL